MKIGVIGKGFVGSAVYDGLGTINNNMSFYDPAFPETKWEDILDRDIIYICVPTDQGEDGECDISIVEATIERLKDSWFDKTIIIKSTVIPGTTQKLIDKFNMKKLGFVPEFLRERSALTDFIENQDVLVVGSSHVTVIHDVIQSHGKLPKNVEVMSATEAELSKYFNNVFNALRITFANGFYDVCKEMDADYQKILGAMVLRDNIEDNYLHCSENIRGFGGYCLPKDTAAFQKLVEDLGLPSTVFSAIVEDNKLYEKTVFKGMRK